MNAPVNGSPVAPGSILAGKYRVTKVLGRGGMGVVVEAHHTQLDERVALKFLLPDFAAKPEFAERFMREARSAVKIKSEHVARVTDVGTLSDGAPFMVMEFLDGRDLSTVLQEHGRLALEDAVDYVLQAADAIAEAHHSGIVHRDIKPSNLFLIRGKDGSPIIKVLDFGISKVLGAQTDGLTQTTATMGSALYMSPEQMRDAKSVDHRADIYSLGITLYELLVGRQPYYADTLPELCMLLVSGDPMPLRQARPDLSAEFAQICGFAYERNRDQRFQTVADFAFALAPFAPSRSQHALERIAKMAGKPIPRAGAPKPGATIADQTLARGDRLAMPQQFPVNQAAGAAYRSGPMPNTSTTAGVATTQSPKVDGPRTGKGIAFAAVGLAALLGVGGTLYVYKSGMLGSDHSKKDAATQPETPAAKETSATASVAETSKPAPAAETAATTPVSAASTSASAPLATDTSSPAKTNAPAKTASQPVAARPTTTTSPTTASPQPPAATTPQTKSTNAFDRR